MYAEFDNNNISEPSANNNDSIRFAMQAAGIGAWNITLPDPCIVSWDDRCRDLFGLAKGNDLSYEQIIQLIHKDDRVAANTALQNALDLAGNGSYDILFRTVGADDGKLRWVRFIGKRFFDDAGQPSRLSGIGMDVTEDVAVRKKAETADIMAKAAIKGTGVGLFHISMADDSIEYSPTFAAILTGKPSLNLTRSDFLRHIHPDDRESRKTMYEDALQTGALFYEARTIWHDGSIHWVRTVGIYKFDEAGKPLLFSGTVQDITTEHKTREDVVAVQQLAELAIRSSGIGIFRFDLVADKTEYSAAFASIFTGNPDAKGLDRKDFIQRIHPEDEPFRAAIAKAAFETGEFNYEPRIIWDDGSVHRIRVLGACVLDDGGNPVLFSGTVQNITEQEKQKQALKHAEDRFSQAMRQSEAMFRNVTSTSPAGLWMSDEDGLLIYLNKTLTEWTGMPYESLLGNGWANAVTDEDRPRAAEAFLGAIARRGHYDVEFRINKGSGEVIWCRAAGDPYYNEDGTYAGYVGFCMDINERVLAENSLKASEEQIRAIVDQAPVAIGLLSGRNMIVQTANSTILKVWGKDESIIGLPLEEALPELEGQPFIALLENVFDTGKPFYGYATLAKLVRNGILEDGYFDFVYTPMLNAGKITGVMVLATDVTAQMAVHKALEESELFSRDVFYNSPVAKMVLTGHEMRIRTINENMLEMLGRDATVIGAKIAEVLPELMHTSLIARLNDVLATGETFYQPEERIELIRYGQPYTGYYNYIYKALRNISGDFYGLIVTATEVTDQVTARTALEASEVRWKSLVEGAPFPIGVYIGKERRIELANQSILDVWGKGNDVIGKLYSDILPELQNQEIFQQIDSVYNTGIPVHKRNQRVDINVNGQLETYYFNYSFTPLRDAGGSVYGVMNTAADVTDLISAKLQTEQAEEALRGAVELAELGTWQLDLSTGIMDYSPRLREWFGFSNDEEITIERGYSAIRKEDYPLVKTSMTHAVTPGTDGIYDVEYYVQPAQEAGKARILHAQGKAFFNEQGQAYKVTGTAQDVTKQREIQLALEQEVQQRTEQLEASNEELQAVNEELASTNEELHETNEQLLHSNEELAQYAYVASHDLQEPLRKIRMFSSMLGNKATLTDEHKMLVEKIGQSSDRMTLLIRDLLEFSRLLKSETLMRPVDLSTVMKAVTNDFELTIKEKNATIDIGDLPVIEGVNLQMNQLFYNLLGNALKFTAPGRPPRISIYGEPISADDAAAYIVKPLPFSNYYRITFSDNGIGFEPKYSEQIFEVFKRLHGREIYPGSGIGLALCRRIAANHNGHLYVHSEPDKGTTFHIIIPDKQHDTQTTLPDSFSWTVTKPLTTDGFTPPDFSN